MKKTLALTAIAATVLTFTATTAEAFCRSDEQAVGGGFTLANQAQLDVVQESIPVVLGPLQGWHVKIVAMPPLGGNHAVRAYVMCAKT